MITTSGKLMACFIIIQIQHFDGIKVFLIWHMATPLSFPVIRSMPCQTIQKSWNSALCLKKWITCSRFIQQVSHNCQFLCFHFLHCVALFGNTWLCNTNFLQYKLTWKYSIFVELSCAHHVWQWPTSLQELRISIYLIVQSPLMFLACFWIVLGWMEFLPPGRNIFIRKKEYMIH